MSHADWIVPWALKDTLALLRALGLAHSSLGGERGHFIGRLVQNADYKALCEYTIEYRRDEDPTELFHCRQALAFFSKLEDLDVGVDKEQVSFERFLASEVTNRETNNRFFSYRSGQTEIRPEHAQLIMAVRDKIRETLGSPPSYTAIGGRFGPGATANVKRESASAVEKLAAIPTCSDNLLKSPLFPAIVRGNESWFANHEDTAYTVVDGWWTASVTVQPCDGKLSFVPKNALTYRSIDVQPTVNGFVQAALGKAIERSLRGVNVDIRDQARNKRLARDGSRLDHVATIDLSSASDSISYEVVKTLLPERWFELLCAARTTVTTYKGGDIRLEMFSAMGNGFTFPLETLLFWAITAVICGEDPELIGVYGDDIICPKHRSESVIRALEFFGFKVNTKKSFLEGPFRESCGGDYYNGISIRPYYQKHLVSGLSLFTLHNFYFRLGTEFNSFRRIVLDAIDPAMRLFGPDGYGDGHLLSHHWDCKKPPVLKVLDSAGNVYYKGAGYCGSYIKSYRILPIKHVSRYPCDLTTPLYACETLARVPLVGNSPVRFSDPVEMSRNGRPMWTYPGHGGVGVVEIYTFD